MRVTGDNRTESDKPMVVRCECGAEVMTLRAGQVLSLRKPGRSLDVTCSSCGKKFTVRVSDVSEGKAA
jgi:hypothetical protein